MASLLDPIIDELTGEVKDYLDTHQRFLDRLPDSEDDVEFLLGIMQEAEANENMLLARAKAITENMQSMAGDWRRKREFMEYKYGKALQAFAAKKLEGSKVKTYKTPYGKLIFRKSLGKIEVLDKELCASWAEQHVPEAVSKSVLVSHLKGMEGELPDCFGVTYPQDVFKIDTGV